MLSSSFFIDNSVATVLHTDITDVSPSIGGGDRDFCRSGEEIIEKTGYTIFYCDSLEPSSVVIVR